jgi:hypothetical protein
MWLRLEYRKKTLLGKEVVAVADRLLANVVKHLLLLQIDTKRMVDIVAVAKLWLGVCVVY